ncbi:unnamed protein product [Rhodiola kirilowii]
MGEQADRVQPDGLSLNGLKPGEPTDSIFQVLDDRRWSIAEESAAELIACIKPTITSEVRRLAVADYVRRLILKCFPCQSAQVFTFGSVPLKTYLPDGDIDLTTISWNPDLKDSGASNVRNMLESEEKNKNAEFRVQEVQYIHAEVKIVKCLVENIVVDISFNQIGGLCTLCFLEEVDHMISHNHLFKRSIILIKAWCYYESRILGAHHGLISTYALETLVLYIFHVFNDTFKGPLEVLYRFLEFFSKFDWENFSVSLWGPVPLGSLSVFTAQPPRNDGRRLLLSNAYLLECNNVYGYKPHQEQQHTGFHKKSFNVVDPLRLNNNLGRSVGKGNFFRIRSAFAFGAMKLARLLDCPEEDLYTEVKQFFANTWQRHGNRIRPDAPCKVPKCMRPSSPDSLSSNVEGRQESCSVDARDSEDPGNLNAMSSDRPNSSCSTSDYAADSEVSSSIYQNSYLDDHTSRHASEVHVSQPGGVKGTLEEEQDRTKMRTSSMFHGFNGQSCLPLNMPLGHLPFAVPPSILASLSCSQKNVGGMLPGNVPLAENPWATHMQFTAVPPAMTHYFNGTGSSLTNSEASEALNEGINPVEVNSWDVESKVWHNHDGSSYGSFGSENGTSEVPFDDRRPSIAGHHFQGKYESLRNDILHHHCQGDIENDAQRSVDLNTLASARDSILRSRTSSGSSWDGTAGKVSKVTKERRGRKNTPSAIVSAANEGAKLVSEHSLSQLDDDRYGKDWKTTENINVGEINELLTVYPPCGQKHQPPGIELTQTNGMETAVNHFSGQRAADNPIAPPLRFIPTGPPVPFFTMLTVYNVPNETGAKSNTRISENEEPGKSESNLKSKLSSNADPRSWDTFDGDFLTHWQNLLLARSCQDIQKNQGLGYPSLSTCTPMYNIPLSGYGRPLPANKNQYTPFTGGDSSFIPMAAPGTSMPNRPPNDYQHCVEEMPRYRGTGTYLPNPKINVRDRQVSGNRGVNYSYDRNDHQGDREGNWNHNRTRVAGRNHIQNQYDKSGPRTHRFPAGAGRSWGTSYKRPDSPFTYQSQVGSLHSSASCQSGSADVAYDTYSLPACSTNGVTPNLVSVPPMVMMYPYGQKVGYSPQPQVLEFGSLGPAELSGMHDFSLVKDASRTNRVPEDLHLAFEGN